MGVRFENGTSYKVEDETSVIDHLEGAVTARATAADGTTATGTAYDKDDAEDLAIHKAESKR
jgi:hypothetical protein